MISFSGRGKFRLQQQSSEPQFGAAPGESGEFARLDDAPDTDTFGWFASSLDLKLGLKVSEEPMDTLPGPLLDEFFKP